jgi:hypothetical protein
MQRFERTMIEMKWVGYAASLVLQQRHGFPIREFGIQPAKALVGSIPD